MSEEEIEAMRKSLQTASVDPITGPRSGIFNAIEFATSRFDRRPNDFLLQKLMHSLAEGSDDDYTPIDSRFVYRTLCSA